MSEHHNGTTSLGSLLFPDEPELAAFLNQFEPSVTSEPGLKRAVERLTGTKQEASEDETGNRRDLGHGPFACLGARLAA